VNAPSPQYHYDWADLAFASKKPLNQLKATFVAAPRELSAARFKQLLRQYLPQGNILLGLSHEPHVLGLEDQPQFRMLEPGAIQAIAEQVNTSQTKYKIYTLSYHQRDLPFILEKLGLARAIFINGSWYHAFHLRPEYYILSKRRIPYELISPFADEAEAKAYADQFAREHPAPAPDSNRAYTPAEMLAHAGVRAKQSFAYSEHQIGTALGRRVGEESDPHAQIRYKLVATAHNRVVPYETYAIHHGAARERNFSPMNDLNHYDVNHAEAELLITAQRQKLDLAGTTLFINVLPCPTCARMLSATDIAEFIYTEDHSAGYAIKMLEAAGKTVRRMVH
jgi:tRNA(Arg) A34 adenosine deaminase TadA